MTTDWITNSKVQPGQRVRRLPSGYIWPNRRHAEKSPHEVHTVVSVERLPRATRFTWDDGKVTTQAPQAKALIVKEATGA